MFILHCWSHKDLPSFVAPAVGAGALLLLPPPPAPPPPPAVLLFPPLVLAPEALVVATVGAAEATGCDGLLLCVWTGEMTESFLLVGVWAKGSRITFRLVHLETEDWSGVSIDAGVPQPGETCSSSGSSGSSASLSTRQNPIHASHAPAKQLQRLENQWTIACENPEGKKTEHQNHINSLAKVYPKKIIVNKWSNSVRPIKINIKHWVQFILFIVSLSYKDNENNYSFSSYYIT